MSEIRLQGVSKKYGKNLALDSIDLAFPRQCFTSLLGPPGAGKTTLLRIIAGIVTPDHGKVFFGEADVTKAPPKKRNVSFIAQDFALYPHMNVFRNIAYPLRLQKVPRKEIEERVEKITSFLKISHLLHRNPEQLSGGEQQRVAISRGLVKDAEVYLFDEPLTNLDYKIREDMRAEFRRIQQETGQTIIYATSDSTEAISMSENLVVLNNGQLVESGNTLEIYRRPQNLFTASFFGYPPMNIFRVSFSQGSLRCPLFSLPLSLEGLKEKEEYSLAVRPEKVTIGQKKPDCAIAFQADVKLVDVIGSDSIIYLVGKGDRLIKSFLPKTVELEIGSTVWVGVEKSSLFLYAEESIHTSFSEVS